MLLKHGCRQHSEPWRLVRAVGEAVQHHPADLQALESWLEREPAVAVGEIGLDFYVDGLDQRRQQALFEAQLGVARDAGLPVIVLLRNPVAAVACAVISLRTTSSK